MSIIVSGSLAYDYIMDFPDSFKHHILPEHIHILNVGFTVNRLEKNFGGTAGNIGYTMHLLGANPTIIGALGEDGEPYVAYLKKTGVDTSHVTQTKTGFTASAHIVTDKDDNQISAFYPGVLSAAKETKLPLEDTRLVIISPNDVSTMVTHAKQAFEHPVPVVFDPGQRIGALSDQELLRVIGQATFLIGNDYEMQQIQDRVGLSGRELLDHVDVLITTLGERGSIITTKDHMFEVEACPPNSVEDPTGAGDAYRAGFFTGYIMGHSYDICGQMGSVAASFAVEHYGTQNHTFTTESFAKRYANTYSSHPNLPS